MCPSVGSHGPPFPGLSCSSCRVTCDLGQIPKPSPDGSVNQQVLGRGCLQAEAQVPCWHGTWHHPLGSETVEADNVIVIIVV